MSRPNVVSYAAKSRNNRHYQKQSDWMGTPKQDCAKRPDHAILTQDFYPLIIVANG
ncbi:hypothetical protein OHAE_1130 [Ochrobactrum soli]|uniref:Uncharacterized protein n=1 Tax=Ochrobactrum soli TaxID=2448455 RepID=A0A2P9HMP9_9HYPH|nr:hypothetical protein OHAE_1130 [[Ochrobactrum] soli]